jgi:hypothetical protein
MPEVTWPTMLAWFGVLTGAASVAGLIVAVVGNRTIKAMHAETQGTLKSLHTETQTTLRTLGEGQKSLGDILDRMDRAAEARYLDLKDRLDGEEDTPAC